MKKQYWVGVKERPPQTVLEDIESNITPDRYPQFKYILGPYDSRDAADKDAKTHVNKDGTFTDPFCNDGGGR